MNQGHPPAAVAVRQRTRALDPDVLQLLRETYLFRDLPDDRLLDCALRMRRRSYPKGAFIWREGDACTEIAVLVSGRVKGARVGSDGDEAVDIVLWGRGEIFGEPGVFANDLTRLVDSIAVQPTDCLLLGRDDLFAMLESDPILMRRMLARLAEMTRERVVRIADFAFLDVTGRVARTLLELAESFGEPASDGTRIDLPMSQRTLAGMVIATRESVNRALAVLIADGAIAQHSGSILVRRPELLRARAQQPRDV